MSHAKVINEVISAYTGFDLDSASAVAANLISSSDTDSAVLQLYHGTNHADWSPVASANGYFGSGVYLSDFVTADNYGEYQHLCEVRIRNPMVVPAQYLDSVGYETPSLLAVFQTLGNQGLNSYLERLNRTDSLDSDCYYPDSTMTECAKAMGHDAIIAVYDDGSFELVALYANQVSVVRA